MKKIIFGLFCVFLICNINVVDASPQEFKANEWQLECNKDRMTDEDSCALIYTHFKNIGFVLGLRAVKLNPKNDIQQTVLEFSVSEPNRGCKDLQIRFDKNERRIIDCKQLFINDVKLFTELRNSETLLISYTTYYDEPRFAEIPVKGINDMFQELLDRANITELDS